MDPAELAPPLDDDAGRSALYREVTQHLGELHSFVDLNLGGLLRRRESVSDIVQSTVRQVLSGQNGFEYRDPASLRAYLCAAAMNKILEKRRYHTAQRRDLRRDEGEQPLLDVRAPSSAAAPAPLDAVLERESLDLLRAAFDSLDEDQRAVLSMRRVFNLSTPEIASALGIAPRTATDRLAKARARLAAMLARGG